MKWVDPLISTNFSKEDEQNGGLALGDITKLYIWTPKVWLYKEKIKDYYSSKQELKSATLLADTFIEQNNLDFRRNGSKGAIVEFTYEISCTFYCSFEFVDFPFDRHICKLRLGNDKRRGTFFRLFDPTNIYHMNKKDRTSRFYVNVSYADSELIEDWINIGLNITLVRMLKPFLMKYYLPCGGVVLIAQLSFIIPLSAIPGRVSFLVTLFLTLINVFIRQMVRYSH